MNRQFGHTHGDPRRQQPHVSLDDPKGRHQAGYVLVRAFGSKGSLPKRRALRSWLPLFRHRIQMFESCNSKGRPGSRRQAPRRPEWHPLQTPMASAPILAYLGGSGQGCRAVSPSIRIRCLDRGPFLPGAGPVRGGPAAVNKCPTEFGSNSMDFGAGPHHAPLCFPQIRVPFARARSPACIHIQCERGTLSRLLDGKYGRFQRIWPSRWRPWAGARPITRVQHRTHALTSGAVHDLLLPSIRTIYQVHVHDLTPPPPRKPHFPFCHVYFTLKS